MFKLFNRSRYAREGKYKWSVDYNCGYNHRTITRRHLRSKRTKKKSAWNPCGTCLIPNYRWPVLAIKDPNK